MNLKKIIGLCVLHLILYQPLLVQSSIKDSISEFDVDFPANLVGSEEAIIQIQLVDSRNQPLEFNGNLDFNLNNSPYTVSFQNGKGSLKVVVDETKTFHLKLHDPKGQQEFFIIRKWPPFISILPPLIAILFAIIFKEVITALLIGVFTGLIFILGATEPLNWLRSPLVFMDTYLINVLTDSDKISVIVFSMTIGGMVALLIKNGAIHFLIRKFILVIKTRKATLITTWLLGILIFFDDYANTLIVGNASRPLTDKFKISRQKLAYIVDSTAAPVAAVALITTWIGAQINYISDSVVHLNLDENPYMIFLNSLGYAFYPVLTLLFIYVLNKSGRDFGPMFKAEKLAISDFDKHLEIHGAAGNTPSHEVSNHFKTGWLDSFIPLLGLILVAFTSLFFNQSTSSILADESMGIFLKIISIIGNGNPYSAMLYASLFGVCAAFIFTLIRRNIDLRTAVDSIINGFRTMLFAMVILVLAWVLGKITEDLHTAVFLADLIGKNVPVVLLSSLIFMVSAAIAFSTGTSWGTMAILYPILLPVTYKTALMNGMPHDEIMPFFHQVVAAILGGAVFGDHCSPISDTTIMSSMASGCNHIEHVRTQFPYALTVGLICTVAGYLLVSLTSWPSIIAYLISLVILIAIIYTFGKRIE